jgi:hypothetical protein
VVTGACWKGRTVAARRQQFPSIPGSPGVLLAPGDRGSDGEARGQLRSDQGDVERRLASGVHGDLRYSGGRERVGEGKVQGRERGSVHEAFLSGRRW